MDQLNIKDAACCKRHASQAGRGRGVGLALYLTQTNWDEAHDIMTSELGVAGWVAERRTEAPKLGCARGSGDDEAQCTVAIASLLGVLEGSKEKCLRRDQRRRFLGKLMLPPVAGK